MYYITRVQQDANNDPQFVWVKDTKDDIEEKLSYNVFMEYIRHGVSIQGFKGRDVLPAPQKLSSKLKLLCNADIELSKDGKEIQYIKIDDGKHCKLPDVFHLGDCCVFGNKGILDITNIESFNGEAFHNFYIRDYNQPCVMDISGLGYDDASSFYYSDFYIKVTARSPLFASSIIDVADRQKTFQRRILNFVRDQGLSRVYDDMPLRVGKLDPSKQFKVTNTDYKKFKIWDEDFSRTSDYAFEKAEDKLDEMVNDIYTTLLAKAEWWVSIIDEFKRGNIKINWDIMDSFSKSLLYTRYMASEIADNCSFVIKTLFYVNLNGKSKMAEDFVHKFIAKYSILGRR